MPRTLVPESTHRTFVVCGHPALIPNLLIIPLVILVRVSNPSEDDEVVTHLFFPTRSIPYKNACQLEDRENADCIEARRDR